MALYRLLLRQKPEISIHFQKTALSQSARWCASSSGIGSEKPLSSGNLEAQKFDNKYMERHSEALVKRTKGYNEVGKSWTLKSMFTKVKEKVLGSPQLQDRIVLETFDSAADRKVSVVIKAKSSSKKKSSPKSSDIDQSDHTSPREKVTGELQSCKQDISTGLQSDLARGSSSSHLFDCTASNEVVQVPTYLDSTGPGEPKNIIHSENLVSATVSGVRKECVSNMTIDPFHIVRKSSLVSSASQVASKGEKVHESYDIGQPDHTSPWEKVTGESQSCKQDISTSLQSDLVRESSSSDVLDCTSLNEVVEVPKLVDITGPDEPKNKIHSENLVSATVSEVRRARVNEKTNDPLHIVRKSFLGGSTSQVTPEGEKEPVGHKDLEHNLSGLLTQSLGESIYSHKNEKYEELAAFHKTSKRSKKMGRLRVKPEPHRRIEVGVIESPFDRVPSVTPGSSRILQERFRNGSTVGNGDYQPGTETSSFGETPTGGSDVGKIPALPNGSQQMMGLNDNKADEMTIEKSEAQRSHVIYEVFGGTNDAGKKNVGYRISNFIGSINGMPTESSTNSTLGGGDDLEVAVRRLQVRPTSKEDLSKIPITLYQKKSEESKVLVRFLPAHVQESTISHHLRRCGYIVKTQLLPLIEGSNFRDAYVHFQFREGSQNALRKTDFILDGSYALVEPSSLEQMSTRISIPNLIGDPEAPLLLVKNPTRTVKIEQLANDISSHQLKEALGFCGGGISRFFMGSSSSVAYVEFETEDAKERAIAAYSINVQGRQLLIFRIDAPRTTVIRITNLGPSLSNESMWSRIKSICKFDGQVYSQRRRGNGIIDIYFKIAEWPNMLAMLNRLNGMEVDGDRLLAQPAPVFPPAVLQVLWNDPDGRIHVKSVLRRLLQQSEVRGELMNHALKYYGD